MNWLWENPTDVLCLQETKLTDDKFPASIIEAAGYHVVYSGQKTYNGVAILSKLPITDVVKNNPRFDDPQQRILAATIDGVRVVCAYVPNGQSVGSEKYEYKLGWLSAFHDWISEEAARHPQLAVVGDYNIAPEHLTDAIERIVERSQRSLSDDRTPAGPYGNTGRKGSGAPQPPG